MSRWRPIARVSDVPEGRGLAVEVNGKRIALFNIDGNFKAIEATCSQHGAPLEKGVLVEGSLRCPWHGTGFDVARGVCSAFPSAPSTMTYEVRVDGDEVVLEL